MASSKLRTHPGKSRNNDGRSTTAGLLQRAPIADELRRSSRNLESVRLAGGVLMLIATDKADGNWLKPPVQTLHLARTPIPEFVIDDHESESDPQDTREVNIDGARHSIRGPYEL